ncbi:MAG: PAS domain S-box protein [Gemmatimonadetes bacterium]|nr:PAS domain S-box protein [Gemmatimonadota bacterium]
MAEERLTALEQRVVELEAVVDNVIDGIITIDKRGHIQSFNRMAEGIFGYSAAEVIGQNVCLLMPDPYKSQHDAYMTSYLSSGEEKIIGIGREVLGQRKDGQVFPIDLAVGEFRLGERRLFTGLIRDITERKRLEAQLVQAQKMESVGRLAGGIAHDFNNQLGIILFDVDMILATMSEEDPLREDLAKIRKAVMRSANLTRQLLLFSRRQPMEMRPTNLNRQIAELQKMLGRLLGEDVEVLMDLSSNLSPVRADHGNIDQVLINLAINARDAMPGGGELNIYTANVVVDEEYCKAHSDARPGPFVCLRVADTGTGMEEKVREQVFEPFFTTKEMGKGTGLGLAVVYGIVQAHEGWIAVQSEVGEGTEFEIFLPALVSQEEVGSSPEEVDFVLQDQGQRERILLVEDEDELRERMEKLLVRQGYQVEAHSTADEAREAFRHVGGNFDLVLSDVVLPDGRGNELVSEFRSQNPDLPVLLSTGYTDERLDLESLRRQGIPFLQKPFAVADLLEQVRRLLEKG